MTNIRKIGFIGGGNMAEALIKGLLSGDFPAERIMASEPSDSRREHLIEAYGIELAANNLELMEKSDIIVLAIKPQIVVEVLEEVAGVYQNDKLIVSILAGVTSTTIEKFFQGAPRVVRVMPNTPALVGEAASAICRGHHASQEDLAVVRTLLETVGMVQLIDERQMDAATGLSGSGPAYIYTVIEALADGGVREGLRRDVAHALAVQTVVGAALMVRETKEHPAILRDQVCSPGGTAITGVSTLEKNGLRTTLMEAVSASAARSRELGGS
ncbi:MAG: pyrroline-5-carboxylate reductase [Deltaproteobacteria bacterium]|jgi:pyrroline-5-carboxylate reductase|nr:pyrroline-5-carboxylate reductase [Deltaproteobacteria bacterium]MCW8893435.1 pyrroline-5-carboxylate reductase [Deltaproteobacteria bacterium]MCW9048936.1 pyrroline-5-carboxylate reductase [Deltaproteobacteria bacterium]